MSHITDEQLFEHSDRVKGRVVVITGAANGIGKETAIRFASYGAKVVIGDRDVAGGLKTVREIEQAGGQALALKCDVTIWDDLVAMFDLAIARYGSVDIVIPNAGVTEVGSFDTVEFKDGKPVPPNLGTINVNLLGVFHTTYLAQHYLKLNRTPGSLKSVVLIGSMASWTGVPKGAMYAASKHAILGMMRSLTVGFQLDDIRIASIHPFFADTSIVPLPVKLLLAGIPLSPIPRIAGAIFCAATHPDPATSGCAWLIPDDGLVFLVPKEEFKLGVYGMIDARANALLAGVDGVAYYARLAGDLVRLLGKPVLVIGLGASAAKLAWDNRGVVAGYVKGVVLHS